jgi:hypothetical protein
MIARFPAVVILLTAFVAHTGAERCRCIPLQSDLPRDFRQLLDKFADVPPDPCDKPSKGYADAEEDERSLFGQAANMVTQGLNAAYSGTNSPKDRAAEALKKLEQASTEANAAWPDENRFHYYLYDFPPVLVLKMTIRTHATFFVFGVPEESYGKPNRHWRQISSFEESFNYNSDHSGLDIYTLHRGPSGNARFLSKFDYGGCAGNVGFVYDAREWDSKGAGNLKLIFMQSGWFGTGSDEGPFASIGTLQTEGTLITLPYCWYSPIDTWHNPSMCAVDTYDISGDKVRLRSRDYNRPDILPIAEAIEYARKGDYAAVLEYCASDDVARRLVRDISAFEYAVGLQVTRTGDGKEQVELSDSSTIRFDVEKRTDRWLVVAFSVE